MYENFIKGHSYCGKCKTELIWNEKTQEFNYQCECFNFKGRKNYLNFRWCDKCNGWKKFRGLKKDSKCAGCSAVNGGKATGNLVKNMSEEERKEWTYRSCNSPTADKNPKSKSENTGYKWCKVCKENTFHLNNCCTKCHPSSGTGRPITSEKAKEMRSLVKNVFDLSLLNDYSYHVECNKNCKSYNYCTFKNNILKNKWGWCSKSPNIKRSNFIKLDILTYKNEPVYQILEKLDSGEYYLKDFPGFNKRWCSNCNKLEWHYDTDCLICETKNILDRHYLQFRDGIAYWKDELVSDITSKLESSEYSQEYYPEFNKRFCSECSEVKWHLNKTCLDCGNENLIDRHNFKNINGILTYKDEPVTKVASKILSGEYNVDNFPGFSIRYRTHVCFGIEDIITGEKYPFDGSNFSEVNDVLFVYDDSVDDYVPADEFYAEYDERMKSVNPDQQVKDFIEAEDFEIVPIIGDGVEKWNRTKTDKYLSDHGYGYFCYVKLLDNRLWIGGKTSTSTVSNSPIDFDFKLYDEKNLNNPDYAGAGREYARRYYPDWKYSDFKFVLCKKCGSEQEALEMEDYIVKKYNLFES